MDVTYEKIREIVEFCLASHLPEGGSIAARKRFLEASPRPGTDAWRIDIDSTELDLATKTHLERAVTQKLRASLGRESTAASSSHVVYFRKPGAPGRVQSVGAPKAPFGVTFQRRAIPGVRSLVVVASGKGGVGKSTVSSNLAAGLAARGLRVGLLDADIYGPSAPLMFSLRGPLQVTSDRRLLPLEAFGVKVMSMGFFADGDHPAIWRGPMVSKALEQLAYDTAWGDLDYLVVDLPPGTGDVQLTLIEKMPIRGAVLVTTPQDVALIDVRKAWAMFHKLQVPILGMVENMAIHHCRNCGHEEAIFGDEGVSAFAAEKGIEILARLPLDAGVRLGCDSGRPIVLDEGVVAAKEFQKLSNRVSRLTSDS